MQFNRRITNGLAWAGAFLVVGVPAADMLSAQFLGDGKSAPAAQIATVAPEHTAPIPAPQSQRPAAKPAEVANAAPAKPQAAAPAKPSTAGQDRVQELVQSGKPLPSYITDAPAKPAETASVKPAPAAVPAAPKPTPAPAPEAVAAAPVPPSTPLAPPPASPATDPVQTASIAPKTAPMPMPLSMRPQPSAVASANQPTGFAVNEPVFVRPSVEPVRPNDITADELEDWESGPLADFLARRDGRQQAVVRPQFEDDREVYFEEEPEFQRRDRLVGPEMFFFPQ